LALSEFKPDFYDLMLTDIYMPGMSGLELCQKILELDSNVRVCFMSAAEVNIDALREVYPNVSFGCFIQKPITIDKLVRRLLSELMPLTLNDNEKPAFTQENDLVKKVKTQTPLQNMSQSSLRQIHFLICESCFWCASASHLYFIKNETIPKCPLCDGNKISIIPILRG
jgi:CheY-like chemotaxis protein